MRKLYHYPICPLSRQVRLFLKELDLPFTIIKEDYWQRNKNFLLLNPAGTLPVLKETYIDNVENWKEKQEISENSSYLTHKYINNSPFSSLATHKTKNITELIITGIYPIAEYLNEKYPNFNFMDKNMEVRCEIRRLFYWFNDKFYREVTKIIIDEKIVRPTCQLGGPRTAFLRAAKNNLTHHLDYIANLLETRSFIGSHSLSCSDIAAACHISVIDYFGEINWDKWLSLKHWYAIVKSRPSFRSLLQDHIPGFTPPAYYGDLDF